MKLVERIAILVVVASFCWGCAAFIKRGARTEQVPKGAKIGVVVLSEDSDEDQRRLTLEDYLTAALVGRGYKPVAMDIRMLWGDRMIETLRPQGAYTNTIENHGFEFVNVEEEVEVNVTAPVAPPMPTGGPAEAAVTKSDEPRNELTDAKVRFDALLSLATDVNSKWSVDYLLFVHHFDTYGFGAHVVKLADKTVINSLVISANKKGMKRSLGNILAGSEHRGKKVGNNLEELRFAEYLASKL